MYVMVFEAVFKFVTEPLEWLTALQRFRDFQAALEKHEIPFESDPVYHGNFRTESGMQASDYFFSKPEWLTAVFCSNDQMVFGVLNKAQQTEETFEKTARR